MRLIATALLSVLAVPLPAAAPPSGRGADWDGLARLAPGAEVRIFLAGGKTVRGFLQRATGDSLAVNATTSQETLARPEIKRVQVRQAGHRGRNTLIGLGIGGATGLALGAAADRNSGSGWILGGNAGKAILGSMGVIVGTVVGVAWPTGGWRDVYRVP